MAGFSQLRRRGRRLLAPVLFALAALAVAHSASSSDASQKRSSQALTCGQTVTTSVTLTTNLFNCPENGLIVGASGITIDLGGHIISGVPGSDVGVFVGTFNSVTVTNGTISGFGYGVRAFHPGRAMRVQSMRIGRNLRGIETSARASVITGNAIFDNDSFGIFLSGADAQVTSNTLQENSTGIGTSVQPNLLLSDNRVLSSGGSGVSVLSGGATIRNNVANGNGMFGISVSVTASQPARLRNNKAFFNTELGIDASPGTIDLSGNKAGANGDMHQCANIVCS